MVNSFIEKNYNQLLSIAKTLINKSNRNIEPEDLISRLYEKLIEKEIKEEDLFRYSVAFINTEIKWQNSLSNKGNKIIYTDTPFESIVIIDEEIEIKKSQTINLNDISAGLNFYEKELIRLHYLEKKSVPKIISELKIKLTPRMMYRDLELINKKLKDKCISMNLLSSQE